ncbi:CBS domain containing-hemolysin-like protein [Halarchaeum solikamskense]|uniref:hemolysin family protein n=1 Tax=Halarchaeum nitratireducens TaxID=489913 RepID=UPI001B3AF54C|nr:hemolysin family protein [Halarchaeum solikamskense]MBP2250416.1 CBS domain containing-hemolysin-like protein [Halarchaeum solikamskense]
MVEATFLALAGALCLFFLVCSAFFSSAEIAAFSLQWHRIQSLAAGGDPRAGALRDLREDPNRLLVTILVGNNVVNVAFSTVIATLTVALLPPGPAIVAATVVTSVLVLLFGEVAPKAYGVAHAESWALAVARPVAVLERALSPVVWAFDVASDALTSLLGATDAVPPYVTREEIRALLVTGAQLGVVNADEREMVHAVLDLEQTAVEEVMTPREAVVAVPASATPADARDACLAADVAAVPVYGDDLDDVRGVVSLADAERAVGTDASLDAITAAVTRARESWTVDDLLTELRETGASLAVVTDSQNRTVGVVTRSDVADEVVWRGR